MARPRKGKSNNTGTRLHIVRSGGTPAESAQPTPDDAALAELRARLAAAGVPDEVLDTLNVGADPTELIDNLIEAGVIPSPDGTLAEILEGWKPLLRPGTTAMEAEVWGADFLGLLADSMPDVDDLPAALVDLVNEAELVGSREALAMTRALAVATPEPLCSAASAVANRLVAAGVADPPWVAGLGRPEVGACFGQGNDAAGGQQSLAMTFRYGSKEHALAVLIDHEAGGGIRDCFFAERPDRVRTGFHQAAHKWGVEFNDYSPEEAHEILTRALSVPPCPAGPDQFKNVRNYLDLVRSRAAVLSEHIANQAN